MMSTYTTMKLLAILLIYNIIYNVWHIWDSSYMNSVWVCIDRRPHTQINCLSRSVSGVWLIVTDVWTITMDCTPRDRVLEDVPICDQFDGPEHVCVDLYYIPLHTSPSERSNYNTSNKSKNYWQQKPWCLNRGGDLGGLAG
jgi:hypothetical protein